MVAPFSKFNGKIWVGFVVTLKNSFSYRFHFKATEGAQVFPKNSTRDFQNSPPFERSACFYLIISGNFERFQYFNFKKDFL